QHLVTTSEDRTARLWTAPQDADSAPRHGRWLNLEGADFSSDGRRLVGVLRWQEDNDRVRVWDTATGQELARLEGHPQEVRTAVFSPDGRRVATAAQDATVRTWDAASGQELACIKGMPAVGLKGMPPSGLFV